MRLIQKILNKFKRKETEILTTHTLGKHILETGKVPTPIYTKCREYNSNVSMFH